MRTAVVDAAVTAELRRQVLRPNWAPGSVMPGDTEPGAVHFARLDENDDVLSACVLIPRAFGYDQDLQPSWQLRGMATRPACRGRGIGGELLRDVLAELAERRAAVVWCEARVAALSFYERHGFATVGAEFVNAETGLPHYTMWRRIGLPHPAEP